MHHLKISTKIIKAQSKQHRPPAFKTAKKLECGPMPNLMVTLPNIGGAICSMPQNLADAHY